MRTTDAPRTEVSDREGRFTHDETTPQATPDDGLGDAVAVPAGGCATGCGRTPRRGRRTASACSSSVCSSSSPASRWPCCRPADHSAVLVGLWIWSTEFAFAKRFFDSVKAKADEAWCHAKKHPVSSAVMTIGGLVAAGVAFWAVQHYELVDKAKASIF
jgi:hypothetical protein